MPRDSNISSYGNNEIRRFFVLEDDDQHFGQIATMLQCAATESFADVNRVQVARSRDTPPVVDEGSALGRPLWFADNHVQFISYELSGGQWRETETREGELSLVPWHTRKNDPQRDFLPHAVVLDVYTGSREDLSLVARTFDQTIMAFKEMNYPSQLVWILSQEFVENKAYGLFIPKLLTLDVNGQGQASDHLQKKLGRILQTYIGGTRRISKENHVAGGPSPWTYQSQDSKRCVERMLDRPWLRKISFSIEDDALPRDAWKKVAKGWQGIDLETREASLYAMRIGSVPISAPGSFTFFRERLGKVAQWDYLSHVTFGLPFSYLWPLNEDAPLGPDRLIHKAYGLIKEQDANHLLRINAAVLLEMLWGVKELDLLNHAISGLELGTGNFYSLWKEQLCPSGRNEPFKRWFDTAVLRKEKRQAGKK